MSHRSNYSGRVQDLWKKSAFTLVELLVVIAIIALLISILLPVLNRARDAAGSIVCKSHMHSFGLATYLYADDYKGLIVPASVTTVDSFDVLLNPYLHTLTKTSSGMWRCASDKMKRNRQRVANPDRPRSYVINFYVSGDSRYGSKSAKLVNIPRTIVIFGEYWGTENGVKSIYGAANFFYQPYPPPPYIAIQWEAPLYGRYHSRRLANFVSADLSVQGYEMQKLMYNPSIAGDRFYWTPDE